MNFSSSIIKVILLAALITAFAMPAFAAKLVCKTGFKAGKTAVSLVPGAKVKCVDTKLAASGKKLLTAAGVCGTCHGLKGPYPATNMNANLAAQGYNLTAARITAAFKAHLGEMGSVGITAKNAKDISAYLQTLKSN